MTIDDLIKSGAVKEQKTGGSAAGPGAGGPAERSLTVMRDLTAEEKECWDAYKDAARMGRKA
jgi:hypothetical protein